jgi:asparagine synthase (glutamine-hydrolysing)
MCGIAGIVGMERERCEPLVRQMCDAMVHRGPDDEGFYCTQFAGIGMRRLSIIDLATGHQPIFNETGDIAVVLNGEIYNYRELRRDLALRGHAFVTSSDTEAIVHLYEEYGDDCVRHLRGMFCFAVLDSRRRRLLLARDRFGIKQLYYTEGSGILAFASEIKCLLQVPGVRRQIDPQSVLHYLTWLYVPAPLTMYEGISELPPSHILVWEDGKIQVRRYWRLRFASAAPRSEDDWVAELGTRLEGAVRSHVVSDVPIGAFLSGGIDSGLMVAFMRKALDQPVDTFTVGFEGKVGFYDERADAARVASHFQTRHHEIVVRPDVAQILPRIVYHLDQPLADSSAIPNFYVCQFARTQVKVALSGLGGDELAAGYERYLGVALGTHYRRLPAPLRRTVTAALKQLPDFGMGRRFSSARLKRFAESAAKEGARAYAELISTFQPAQLRKLLAEDWKPYATYFDPARMMEQKFCACESPEIVNRMLAADVEGYLAGDLLPLTDRISMAHSLEVRVPFLDHELMELAASMPSHLKIRKLTKKYILKKIARPLLPSEIVQRQKRGFSIPLTQWLREELRELVRKQLAPERIEALGIFDPTYVSRLLEEHLNGGNNHENRVWALLMFTLWHEQFMEPERVIPPEQISAAAVR